MPAIEIRQVGRERIETTEAPARWKSKGFRSVLVFYDFSPNRADSQNFSLDLWICIPKGILGPTGYLSNKQTSIESISLITGTGCFHERIPSNADIVDLSRFRTLHQISRIGLQHASHFSVLQRALQKKSKCLTHLHLEYITKPDEDWHNVESDTETDNEDNEEDVATDYSKDNDVNDGIQRGIYQNYFAIEALGLKQINFASDAMFPTLTSLSLGFVSLRKAEAALAHAFNVSGLLHLTLRKCPAMDDFLQTIAASGQELRLLSFEYTYNLMAQKIGTDNALKPFLERAPKLTDLVLSISEQTHTLDIWLAL